MLSRSRCGCAISETAPYFRAYSCAHGNRSLSTGDISESRIRSNLDRAKLLGAVGRMLKRDLGKWECTSRITALGFLGHVSVAMVLTHGCYHKLWVGRMRTVCLLSEYRALRNNQHRS